MREHLTSCRRVRVTAAAVAIGVLLVMPVAAHDFWIQPSSFTPPVGSAVQIKLRVGDDFPGEPVARNAAQIETFFVHGPDGRRPVVGSNGGDPAGTVRVTSEGTYLIGYRSRPTPVKLEAAAFERYLKEEGLERIIELRARNGQSGAPGRERFSRSVKSLLHVGGGAPAGHDMALGLMLEIVPDTHPSQLPAGGRLGFRLLYDGRPLEGALVVAIPQFGARRAAADRPAARTTGDGRVELTLTPGAWTLKAVHMVPAPTAADADWESVWTSLTFHAGAAAATGTSAKQH